MKKFLQGLALKHKVYRMIQTYKNPRNGGFYIWRWRESSARSSPLKQGIFSLTTIDLQGFVRFFSQPTDHYPAEALKLQHQA